MLLKVTFGEQGMVKDAVVKIDKELLKRIEGFAKKNKFLYSSKKQVVNLAIIEFLNKRMLNTDKKEGGKKRQNG